jgi:hypothetical protein
MEPTRWWLGGSTPRPECMKVRGILTSVEFTEMGAFSGQEAPS